MNLASKLKHPLGNHIDKRTFGYDSHGRMTSVKQSFDGGADVTLWTGAYNAIGQLATAANGAFVNITRSASGAKLAEKSSKLIVGGGQINTTRHYYGTFEYLGDSLARVNVTGGYIDGNGKLHAYVTDWQGNVRAVASKHGSGTTVTEQATWYYPYGMPTCDSRSADANRYKYTAKELITDHATNLYDYPARLYDPTLSRWTSTNYKIKKDGH